MDELTTTLVSRQVSPPSFWEWLRGKRTSDISLPNEGMVDPRLAQQPNVLEQLQKAAQGYKKLQENEILNSLVK